MNFRIFLNLSLLVLFYSGCWGQLNCDNPGICKVIVILVLPNTLTLLYNLEIIKESCRVLGNEVSISCGFNLSEIFKKSTFEVKFLTKLVDNKYK